MTCSRDDAAVTCRVDRALLGVVPLEGVKIAGVRRAVVDFSNNNYQLAFQTDRGRIAPRGADGLGGDTLRAIAQQVNDLAEGQRDSFSDRTFSGFPTVAGAIFLAVGLVLLFFAA